MAYKGQAPRAHRSDGSGRHNDSVAKAHANRKAAERGGSWVDVGNTDSPHKTLDQTFDDHDVDAFSMEK